MSFFGSSKQPQINDVRITFENIRALLYDEKYSHGLDPNTTIDMINDVYDYVIGNKNMRIRLPAPVSNLEDRFGFMWPEGAKISSRAPSNASTAYKGRKLSSNYNSERARNRATSVASSSKFSARYVGFADEDEPENNNVKHSENHVKHKSKHSRSVNPDNAKHKKNKHATNNGSSVMRVNGQVFKPTPSMDDMLGNMNSAAHDIDDELEEDVPRPAVLRKQAKFSNFADDE